MHSTVDLGRNLGLRVVAEGVEDLLTLQHLDLLGCHAVQGYHISRPVPPTTPLAGSSSRKQPRQPRNPPPNEPS